MGWLDNICNLEFANSSSLMAVPKVLLNAVHKLLQLPWKLILIISVCSISLHLLFFPETRQSIVRWGQSELVSDPANLHNVEVAPPAFEESDGEEYVALCMAIKDQGRDLGEFFIHHYHHVGIRRFYIMDDGSDPPLSTFDYPGVPQSALTFVYFDPANHTKHLEQGLNYRRCLKEYGSLHTWMGFIDGDEFFEMTSDDSLEVMLKKFIEKDDNIGQLVVNWRMHTSAGLLKRPESARKSFVQCIGDETTEDGHISDNQHVKGIVRTAYASHPKGAHMWNLEKGYTVGEHGDVVDTLAFRNPITRDRIALHHYAVKSREEYEEKMHRGNGEDVPKGEIFWIQMEKDFSHVPCPEMAKYKP